MSDKVEMPDRVAEITVKAEGEALPGTFQITKVEVSQQVNKIPQASVTIYAGQMCTCDEDLVNNEKLAPGKPLVIEAGYGQEQKAIFSGVIMEQNLRRQSDDSLALELLIKDKAAAMTVGRKTVKFAEKKKDSDIIKKLIGDAGLTADVEDTTPEHDQMVQYDTTDWDFVLLRAEANGMVALVADGKVTVKAPGESDDEALLIEQGTNAFEIDSRINAEQQYGKVSATGWDPGKQELVEATAELTDNGTGNLKTDELAKATGKQDYHMPFPGFVDKSYLENWTKGMATKSAQGKMQGTFEMQGTADLKAGGKVKLKGFGDRFEGEAWVGGVEHRVEDGEWKTVVSLGLDPTPLSEILGLDTTGGNGQMPGIAGLHIGKVVQIHEDESGNFRVKVKLPLLKADAPEMWARFATFYASNGVGALFYPEVDDEVVVGFFGNDPRYPVILGSMYSKAQKPTDEPAEENPLKQIVTKEKLKIAFDDENKVLTIITPGENQMVFSDDEESITVQDQHENKIEMTKDGITIQTSKKLTLKGEKEVEITGKEIKISGDSKVAVDSKEVSVAGKSKVAVEGAEVAIEGKSKLSAGAAKVAIEGKAKLEASAAQVAVEGKAQLELKGGAQATLQGGAMCEVKGGLVKIN